MYKELDAELKLLQQQLFTGHVRFGIEHGDIASMSITSKIEPTTNGLSDISNEIKKLYPEEKDFYGSIDFNYSFGKQLSANYSVSLQGEKLKERIRNNLGREVKQCRNVKVVAKKSDT